MDDQSIDLLEEQEIEEVEGNFPWVLFSTNDVVYGIFSAHVLSIESLSDTIPLVNSPDYIRGVTDFRGEMISLIDLRTLFGLPNRYQALADTLSPFVQAHKNWIDTLERCVREHSFFDLALDPRLCAFGKWYYSYKNSNNAISLHLNKIEAPHALLHETGAKIVALMEQDGYEEANRLMADIIRPAYQETISLLEGILPAYKESTNDMVVVLDVDGVIKGVIVDEIVSVEYINHMLEMQDIAKKTGFVRNLGKREKDNATVQLMDEQKIIVL